MITGTDREELDALKKQLKEAMDKSDLLLKQLSEERQKASANFGDTMQLQRLQKQLLVINHIVAGRHDEAIKEMLTPIPVLFAMDVRFADDQTRLAAQDSMLEQMKKLIIKTLDEVKVQRTDEEKLGEVARKLDKE